MKTLFNKRILTILGIVFVLIGIPLTTYVLKNQTVFKSRASNPQEPRNIKITNISDTSFTITYQTKLPSTGSISYGVDKELGKSALEDADKEKGSFSPKKIHSISVKELIPSTKYYLVIVSGPNTFLNNGVPFEVTTGPDIPFASINQNTIEGKIALSNGNAPFEALVYLDAENSQLLSSTTSKDGKFSFSLKELRAADFSSYFIANDLTVFKIFAIDDSLKSTALISLNQASSVPTITLSNDYDFTQPASLIESKVVKSSDFSSIILPDGNLQPEIISPKENQSFTDPQPQFRGTSLPNEKVEIIIQSDNTITTQVTANNNGNWEYKPPNDLSPGIHTITIKTRDSSGILTTITRSFTVFAADSQVLESATAPATITQETTPTLTITPTVAPTFIPPPAIETSTPSPTLVPSASKGGLPPTGSSPTLAIGTIGIVTTVISLLMLILIL